MSTKSLAHAVIDGGRDSYSTYQRRFTSQILRANNRRLCKKLQEGKEDWDVALFPRRERNWDENNHKDKTNCCDRFLISRAGIPWNDVYSEICRKFNRRTLIGRHVIDDHLIGKIQMPNENVHRWWVTTSPRFWVDENGILRHNPKARY